MRGGKKARGGKGVIEKDGEDKIPTIATVTFVPV